jgi:hypothetical protein
MWGIDWAWGIPLTVLSVVIHVIGLGLFNVKIAEVLNVARSRPHFTTFFAIGIGFTVLWATLLHAFEAALWALAYRLLGAVPDSGTAMLYSLSAITTYGHSEVYLTERWRLLGAVEALNGIILIGLTTALLYGLIQHVWPVEERNLPSWSRRKNHTAEYDEIVRTKPHPHRSVDS